MQKIVVIIPTYNEVENIAHIVRRVRESLQHARVLVVDDNSPDGTGAIVRALMAQDSNISLLSRRGKDGLGKAYLDAFAEVLKDQSVEWVQVMDADFSHDPKYLPNLSAVSDSADVVIGSRYVAGGGTVGWTLWRKLLSRFANLYCRIVTGMPISDCTAGFILMRADLLRAIPLQSIKSSGFAFLMELKYMLWKHGARIAESPVMFQDRLDGTSKLSGHIVREGLLAPLIMRFKGAWWRLYVPFLIALMVGAIYAGPDIYNAITPGYQGIMIAGAPDADFYLTNINKSYKSAGLIGDPFQYEYQKLHNPFQYFGIEFVLGKIGNTLNLPIDILNMTTQFFLPALLALLLFALGYSVSGSWLSGALVAVAMLLGNEAVHPNGVANFFGALLFHGDYREFLNYSRPVNPQASGLLFFGVIYALHFLLKNSRLWYGALVGCAVGALLYIYVYSWAFAFVALGVMFLYALVSQERNLATASAAAVGTSVLVALPFLFSVIPLLIHGGGGGLTQAISTHHVIVEKVILLPLALYALAFFFFPHLRKKYMFVMLLLVAGVVVSNEQVLTGKMIFQQHFHFYSNIPMFLLATTLLFAEMVGFLSRKWRMVLVLVFVCGLVWFAIGVQVSSYRNHAADSAREQALAPVFAYLRELAPSQAVVLSDKYLSTRLTIYTQDFAYSAPYDVTYAVPQERLLHDYFVVLALRGVTKDAIRSYVYKTENREEVGNLLFVGTYWRDKCGSYACFPDSVLEDIIPQYQNFLSSPLLTQIKKYKINYILVDRVIDSGWKNVPNIIKKSLTTSGDFTLYSIQ